MIERIWSGRSRLYLLLLPISLLYGAVSWLIHFCYRRGWFRVWRAPVPVVVVGNLTVGGNGKTPLVIWLVNQLQQAGLNVGVVSRGYGGKAEKYPLILTNNTPPGEAGDEPVLIRERTGAMVAVSPRRREAAEALIQCGRIDIIVTDDGLQHYALARDFEIVVIDGERRFGNGWWLPAGPMRERKSRLNHVSAIVNNGGKPGMGEIAMALKPGQAINIITGACKPPSELTNVVAIAGIGYPARFFNLLNKLNVCVCREVPFADHYAYDATTLHSLITAQETLLMTEKDAVKVRDYATENWWYLPVEAELTGGGHELVEAVLALRRLH